MKNPLKYFAELTDPRVERTRAHVLEEILLIAIAAVLSGAESWNDIADYGESKQEWLKTFLELPGGIPSHDTFNRVFAALDPVEFERSFADWVASIARLTAGEVVAIDGKTLCGTREVGKKQLVHMVSAWASANNLVLGQRKVDEKSNEITAIFTNDRRAQYLAAKFDGYRLARRFFTVVLFSLISRECSSLTAIA